MTASRDEASVGYTTDAPYSLATNFYILFGDIATGFNSSSQDYDSYFIKTNVGNSYTALISNRADYQWAHSRLMLSDRYGNTLSYSVDYGDYAKLSFTASDSMYFITSSSPYSAYYSIRISNNSLTELNGIGETITTNVIYNAALDYASDSDHFLFGTMARHKYELTINSKISDIYLKITDLLSGVALTDAVASSGTYTWEAPLTGVYELSISSNGFFSTGAYSIFAREIASDGPNTLTGSDQADTIDGLGGDDLVYGMGGNDTIVGGLGNDIIYGGAGNDSILDGQGKNLIDGGDGIDTLWTSYAFGVGYTVAGTSSNFTIAGPSSSDTVSNMEYVHFRSGNTVPVAALWNSALSVAIANQLFVSYMGRAGDVQWRASTAAALDGGQPSVDLQKNFYSRAVAEGVFSSIDSSLSLVNKVFYQIFNFGASDWEQHAWVNLVDSGILAKEQLPWGMFVGYLGSTTVPDAYRVPCQCKLLAVDAYTNELLNNNGSNTAMVSSSEAFAAARSYVASVNNIPTAASAIVKVAASVASISSSNGIPVNILDVSGSSTLEPDFGFVQLPREDGGVWL